jgi:hypothetical protein
MSPNGIGSWLLSLNPQAFANNYCQKPKAYYADLYFHQSFGKSSVRRGLDSVTQHWLINNLQRLHELMVTCAPGTGWHSPPGYFR